MESDAAGEPTNITALQFSQYSTATDLTASIEQRHRRTQSYDPVAEPWRQTGRIRICACHQHTNVDTSYVIQLTAAGPPCREETGTRIKPCGTPNFTVAGCELELSQRTCCKWPSRYKANRQKLSLRRHMMSVNDVRALSGRLYQKPPTSPVKYRQPDHRCRPPVVYWRVV